MRFFPVSLQLLVTVPLSLIIAEATDDDPAATPGSNEKIRIVGGVEVVPHSLPYQLHLQVNPKNSGGGHTCGAVLIAPAFALTAAHCTDGTSVETDALILTAGAHDMSDGTESTRQVRTSMEVLQHPDYDPRNQINDITVLKVDPPFEITKEVKDIHMADASSMADMNKQAIVSGWGRTAEKNASSEKLLQVNVPLISEKKCKNLYRDMEIFSSMLCAGHDGGEKDSCQGDSGGPLVQETNDDSGKILIGIVSWGIGCARAGKPGVYTEVSFFRSWIQDRLDGKPDRAMLLL